MGYGACFRQFRCSGDERVTNGGVLGFPNMSKMVYFDTVAFRRIGKALESTPLPNDLRGKVFPNEILDRGETGNWDLQAREADADGHATYHVLENL